MLKKPKKRFSRVLSGVLAVLIATPNLMQIAASAEEGEKFQYTMFGRNGIAMSGSSNLCMNGNLHTNKEAEITATNKNINGTATTASNIEKRIKHVYADQKIYDTYFTTNCELHEEYVCSDMNIHINNPIFAYNSIVLSGNISLNSYLGTYMDINITGEVENANNAVLYSKYGDITIDTDNVANMNGLVYAPLGTVTIDASNVNLNGVIIADQVVINGSSVNINCNDNIARFIGETSEEYDFSGLEYLPEEWLGDTDADALFDIYEKVIDSDPFNPDTDGDGLPDGYEVLTLNTDPLEIDTDGNGVLDGNEDFDTDNLVNIDEYHNQTLPFIPDTDEDGFVDGDEVHIYGTIPTNPDTDGDDLLDGEESYDGSIYLEYGVYFDPLNPDTDDDGIADGDEVFGQTKEQEVQTQDEAITEVIVDMETNGNIDRALTVESMQGIDAMTSNVHALVGEPFNFETESDFESATITFKIDQSKLGDTKFDKLLILWYNEAEKTFVEMDTAHDAANSTVSTTTTHFSQYMIVDSEKWFENWDNSLSKLCEMWSGNTSYTRNLHTLFLLDCSTQMGFTDEIKQKLRVGLNGLTQDEYDNIRADISSGAEADSYIERYGAKYCDRLTVCENIIDSIWNTDSGRVITFSNAVEYDSGQLHNQQKLKQAAQNVNNDGGTAYLDTALDYACSFIDGNSSDLYRIVVITSNDVTFGRISADDFSSNTMLNIVNLGSSEIGRNIDAVAQATGGDVYNAISASVLTSQHGETTYTPPQFIGIDSDGDTIPDIVEEYGLKPNGEPIGTNPNLKDSDGDGIEDQIELGYMNINQIVNTPQGYLEYLTYTSDPAKADTDGDGYSDAYDAFPLTSSLIVDGEASEALMEELNEYLNHIMPPLVDENGKTITSKNKECGATWDYFGEIIWPGIYEDLIEGVDEQYHHLYQTKKYAAYTAWIRDTYGVSGLEKVWLTSDSYVEKFYYELIDFENTLPSAISQTIKGNYTEEITITGTTGQIILGFTGIDFVADIRDVTYDVTHWEWSWSHAGQTGIDMVGLFPLIGMIKCSDEFAILLKNNPDRAARTLSESVFALTDDAGNIVKNSDQVVQVLKTSMTLSDAEASKLINLIAKHSDVKLLYDVDIAKSILKLSDESADAFLKVANKQGDEFITALRKLSGTDSDKAVYWVSKYGENAASVITKVNASVFQRIAKYDEPALGILTENLSNRSDELYEILNTCDDRCDNVLDLIAEYGDDAVNDLLEVYDHKAITGVYMLLDNLSIRPTDEIMKNVWDDCIPTMRGKHIEDYYAATKYKTWHHIGSEYNGYFPVIDFVVDDTIISMKTLDPRLPSYQNMEYLKEVVKKYAKSLNELKIYHDNVLYTNKKLQIIFPTGTITYEIRKEVKFIADQFGIEISLEEMF